MYGKWKFSVQFMTTMKADDERSDPIGEYVFDFNLFLIIYKILINCNVQKSISASRPSHSSITICHIKSPPKATTAQSRRQTSREAIFLVKVFSSTHYPSFFFVSKCEDVVNMWIWTIFLVYNVWKKKSCFMRSLHEKQWKKRRKRKRNFKMKKWGIIFRLCWQQS